MSGAELAPDTILDPSSVLPNNDQPNDLYVSEEPDVADLEDPVAEGIKRAKKSIKGDDVPKSRNRYLDEHMLTEMRSVQRELGTLLITPCLTPEEQGRRTEGLRRGWNLDSLTFRIVHLNTLKEHAGVRKIVRAALASISLENS